jgi:hypothetical protein
VSKDIDTILDGWEYNPGRVNARWITGSDGLPKIQLRLDLGILQMEIEGRPDGSSPRGFPSLKDYYATLEQETENDHPGLRLNEEACAELQQEAVQYYYRYLAFYALGHLDGVISDTEHNLSIFSLVANYAVDEELAWPFLQFFPYVRMMNARAIAERAMEDKNHRQAADAIQLAIDDIRDFLDEFAEFEEDVTSEEIELLSQMLEKIRRKTPKSREEKIREDLELAIAAEDYEQAAMLRDMLASMSGKNV